MRKKGFTLVELLAVIILMGLLFIFVTKNILQKGNQLKQISEKEQEKIILSCAKSYFMERNSLKVKAKSGQIIAIRYTDLQSKGYLPETLQNVKTYKNIDSDKYSVCVKYDVNKYIYNIVKTGTEGLREPELDENGNVKKDEEGNIIYKYNIVHGPCPN